MATAVSALVLLLATVTVATEVRAQTLVVDPAAKQILQKMTEYLSGLKQFSVHTENTFEDVLETGQRVDYNISANVIIRRPNKLFSERKGDDVDQTFYYDGKTLTLHNPSEKVFASESAPATIEEMLDYVRESLGLNVPVADLIYRNAFPLLMQDVSMAMVIGKSTINGVKCDHLLFSRPGVEFQVWVADSGPPLPYKYIVTDTGLYARLSVSTTMSDWDTNSSVDDDRFTFVPPKEAKLISFMPF
jgi:hypothetical protein